MLILTRKVGEIIHIGDDITVIVKSVSGKTVRLGVMAPSEVPIYREELLRAQSEPSPNAKSPRRHAADCSKNGHSRRSLRHGSGKAKSPPNGASASHAGSHALLAAVGADEY